MPAWTLLIACHLGHLAAPYEAEVDLIEVNHTYTIEGRHLLDQVILWDWSESRGEYLVVAWQCLESRPVKRDGKRRVVWDKRRDGFGAVVAPAMKESWTVGDPERENIKVWPEKFRRRLW